MLLLNLLAFCAGAVLWLNQPTLLDTIAICLCWNTFNLFLVICCLGVVWERRQLRRSHRYSSRERVILKTPAGEGRWAAFLRDLSISGVGVTIDASQGLPGSQLVLEAADSYGKRYDLPIQVLRTQEEGRAKTLGCRFETGPEALRRQLIGFVYGDSRRWKYFAEGRRIPGIGTIRAFFKLVYIGLKGSGRHAAGLIRLGIQRIRSQAMTA
jgi:cellulose synthase (UDP-forming)